MTTLTGSTFYLRQLSANVQYSQDNSSNWTTVSSWPVTLDTSGATLSFTTDLSLNSSNNYFIINNSGQTIDGNNYMVYINNLNYWVGLVKNGGYVYTSGNIAFNNDAKSNITVKNISVSSVNSNLAAIASTTTYSATSAKTGSGWICQAYFGNGTSDNNVINCNTNGSCSVVSAYSVYCVTSTSINKSDNTAYTGGGGILGDMCTANVSNCFSTGKTAREGGCIVGRYFNNTGTGSITNCYSTGNLVNSSGGIAGNNCMGPITACYSTYSTTGSDRGGILGPNGNSFITNSYILMPTSTSTVYYGLCSSGFNGTAPTNYYATNITSNVWSDTTAKSTNYLVTSGGVWTDVNLNVTNVPYRLSAFTAPLYNSSTGNNITSLSPATTYSSGYTWSIVSISANSGTEGATYTGISISSSTGALSFSSLSSGTYAVKVMAVNSSTTGYLFQTFTNTVGAANTAPTITSGATATTSENTTSTVYTVTATDPDAGNILTYSISGGVDASLCSIDASGNVTFKVSPNYEAPTDSGANNVYDIIVSVSDGTTSVTKAVAITVTNVNEAPSITSGATASTSENTTSTVYTVTATDPDANTTLTYSISGGVDASLCSIDASGNVTFRVSPNFEAPSDSGANNVYDIIVSVSDGTNTVTKAVAITVTNVNESAVISGTSVGAISETNAAQTVSGSLSVSDPDAGQSSFVARTDVSGNNNYGSFTIDASGAWSYTMSTAHNEFVAGQTYTDSITVSSYDGSANQVITVTMTGTNDAAVISGTSTGSITESNAIQTVSSSLRVTDADAGQSSFVARTDVSGNNNYGSFTIDASGNWSYTMSTPHNEFVAGQMYTDSIIVSSYDGSATQVITVTMTGTNDTAVISGTSTASITESNAVQSVSGSLSTSDADAGQSSFVAQTDVSGNNNYGSFTIDASGNWSYTMSTPHNEFAEGILYTDSLTVTSVDGSANQVITVTILGTNDSPIITNSSEISRVTTAIGTSAVYTVTATDVDANTTFAYAISGGADAALFEVGSTTGEVKFKATPSAGTYFIIVKVTDENSAYDTKAVTVVVTSENAANYNTLTESTVSAIVSDSVIVGAVTVTDLTTSAGLEIPDGATLTVGSGEYSGALSGNGSVAVTGTVDLTTANLDDYSGAFTVSGTLTIANSAGSIITLTSNNDGTTTVSVKISSTDPTAATTISTDMYASSDGTIENTNTEQPVVFTGTLYKPGKTFTFDGLIEILGKILGQTPDSDESLENSDVNIGNAAGRIAAVVYASTDQDAYLYDGATTVYSGSSLTLNNGANLENSVVTINAGATLILNYIDTPIHVKELILDGNLIINVNSTSIDIGSYDILTTTNASTVTNSHVVINDTTSYYALGYSNATNTQYKIAFSTPTSNVCFPAKTPIMTNQGPVNIEDINPSVHTIRNKKIVAITKTVAHDKNLVRIAKHALGHLYPEKTTFISQNHKVFYQGQMVKAKNLVDEAKGVTFVPYNGQVLYNVLLEEHEKMQVNNLIVETLHPEHKVAKLYRFLQNVDAAHHGKLIALFNKCDRAHRIHL
jgi:VCBS repeat-containing protein